MSGNTVEVKRAATVRMRFYRALASALVIVGLLAQPVSANGGAYGWGACTWENNPHIPTGDVEVRAEAGAYSPPALRDGVWNSFTARISAAVADWGSWVERQGLNIDLYRVSDTYTLEEILIYPAAISAWADHKTYATRNGAAASCTMHDSAESYAYWERIRTRIYDHWFTQDDSRRALWEACPSTNSPAYTCSKTMDFESILMHELGHAMGIPHPEDVDLHQPSLSPDAASRASCGTPTDRATMCKWVAQTYRTSGRTLHEWDYNSLWTQGVYH